MAEAIRRTVIVTKPVEEQRVTLDLSIKEAQFLRDILGGGVCGSGPRRPHADDIHKALTDIGFERGPYDFKGSVEF